MWVKVKVVDFTFMCVLLSLIVLTRSVAMLLFVYIIVTLGAVDASPRGLYMLTLSDPLDCLSQVVCGLNTYPPAKPNVKSNNANDFAYLLRGAIRKLREEEKRTAGSPRNSINKDMKMDLRAKLLSESKCTDKMTSCPFNYAQMLSLISSSLEGERTVSYTSSVLPMAGYLLKSRNYTGVLSSTFRAIHRVNNLTIENDKAGRPVDFTHVLDDLVNSGDNGLRIVDTSNESGSTSVWEDDEFDQVLAHPYERKKPYESYRVSKRTTTTTTIAPALDDEDNSSESSSEEAVVVYPNVQKQKPNQRHNQPPPVFGLNRHV